MSDHESIIQDPYNPVKIVTHKTEDTQGSKFADTIVRDVSITTQSRKEAIFPEWLTKNRYTEDMFPYRLNWNFTDHVVKLHASLYDAIIWYPWIEKFTMKSIFIPLTEEDVDLLIFNQELPDDKELQVKEYIKQGYRFIKSSKKSSHTRKKVTTYEIALDELCHPEVIISFKNGCRHIFMRQYVDGLMNEFRIYIYKKKIRYIECYIKKTYIDDSTVKALIEYVIKVDEEVKYEDYILDIAETTIENFICIEINTPAYLFGGLHYADYYFERDKIHETEVPIIRNVAGLLPNC